MFIISENMKNELTAKCYYITSIMNTLITGQMRLTVCFTHIEPSDGCCRLIGLHHLSQSPHLLDAGGYGLRVREALRDTRGHNHAPSWIIVNIWSWSSELNQLIEIRTHVLSHMTKQKNPDHTSIWDAKSPCHQEVNALAGVSLTCW